ncbi:tetratricopeptide repeat protein 7B-like [Oppia nitens]|uniref:tetratricopeptide repeat protein 7B-like n=1 Tax=Oppia nitens TaxID=1686743 RepID=UPI0023DC719A|nr:tetratricopeptide repeat protein 7B-like [Oppia nitens]
MSSPKSRARVESDIERCREESNWRRCLDLAQHMQHELPQMVHFLSGEAKVELYLEANSKHITSGDYGSGASGTSAATAAAAEAKLLNEAVGHLNACLDSSQTSPLAMDANLLLAKCHYVRGDYELALRHIDKSGIDSINTVDKVLPLRVVKLVAESYAVKGMSLEQRNKTDDVTTRTSCLVKASEMAIRYLQNVEKQLGPYIVVPLGSILETAVQRAPIVYINTASDVKSAVNQYRSTLNACETPSTLTTRQILAKQLAELLIRGVSQSTWSSCDLNTSSSSVKPLKPLRYIGQSLFVPKVREEEILLLLLMSESLASRNVVLDRSPEFTDSRQQSLNDVMAIYDLLTITLTPLRCYYMDFFERSMKFSFEVKHIWFQFALTLIESKKCPQRALLLLKEVSRIDSADPLPPLIGAKLCLQELSKYKEGLQLAKEALNRCKDNESLRNKIHIVIGVTNALIYETESETCKKFYTDNLNKSIEHLKIASKSRFADHLPYFHLALHMANQRALNDALKYVKIALLLNGQHLPSIQLLILCLSALKQYSEALALCETALEEYPNHLIVLYFKAHLEEMVGENGREEALLTAKEMLNCWKFANNEEEKRLNYHFNYFPNVNYDTISMKMEQTLSEVASLDSTPIPPANDAMSGTGVSLSGHNHLGGGGGGGGTGGANSAINKPLWSLQMHIWLLIVELFLKLGHISEAESCVNDGALGIFGSLSHQLMYLKGIISKAKGSLIDAKTYLQNAISINPKHVRALQQLGHTYYLLGNHLAADKYLKDSLNIDATVHQTWQYMGLVLQAIDDHQRAADCHLTGLQLEATAPVLPFNVIPRSVLE